MKPFILLLLVLFLSHPHSSYGQPLLKAEPASEAAKANADVSGVPRQILEEGNVNLDFKEADIRNVLRVIALKGGVNIVAGPEVVGTVTVRLQNVKWDKALEVVLKTYGYVFERDGNVVRVTTKDKVSQEELESRTFVLNYSTAAEVAEAITELLSERGKAKSVTRTNTVIVTDTASNLYKISQVVSNLDRSTPQAYIDSKVVATQLDKTENLGINWTAAGTLSGAAIPVTFPFEQEDMTVPPVGNFLPIVAPGTTSIADTVNARLFPRPTTSITSSSSNYTFGRLDFTAFQAILNFLKTRGNTKVVSNPRITVLNNQTAKVQVGQQIYIPTFELNEQTGAYVVNGFDVKDVGVVLNVTPHINASEEILVEVKPEISTFLGDRTVTTGLTAPSFSITTAQTQVLIKDGETIAIGGLLTDNRATTITRVPILGDIPWVGNIFRSKRETAGSGNSKVETLFFITVGIVDTEGQPVRVIKVPSPHEQVQSTPLNAAATVTP